MDDLTGIHGRSLTADRKLPVIVPFGINNDEIYIFQRQDKVGGHRDQSIRTRKRNISNADPVKYLDGLKDSAIGRQIGKFQRVGSDAVEQSHIRILEKVCINVDILSGHTTCKIVGIHFQTIEQDGSRFDIRSNLIFFKIFGNQRTTGADKSDLFIFIINICDGRMMIDACDLVSDQIRNISCILLTVYQNDGTVFIHIL